MTDHSHAAGVIERLEAIEEDLAQRQNFYETAANDRARLTRDWDKRLAIHQKTARGTNAETRKANALVAATEQDDLYDRLTDAEARYDSLRVVVRTLETRATIGMAVLKAQSRA